MLIKLRGTDKEEHVSRTVGSVLITAGLADEVKSLSEKRITLRTNGGGQHESNRVAPKHT
jgi:hypothetical protein